MLNNINSILSIAFKDEDGNKFSPNDILMKYIDDDNAFVTFTDINKLGINLSSDYQTPVGIYCYPIKYAYNYYNIDFYGTNYKSYYDINNNINNRKEEKEYRNKIYDDQFISKFPFTSTEGNYFTIFKCKKPEDILIFQESKFDYKSLIKKSIKFIKKKYDIDIIKDFPKSIEQREYTKYESVGNIIDDTTSLWRFTRNLALDVAYYEKKYKSTIVWFSILKNLGIVGFIDPGYAIIHPNEPCQAVFFDKTQLEIIGTYDNLKINRYSSQVIKKDLIVDKNIEENKYDNKKFSKCSFNNCNIKNSDVIDSKTIKNSKFYKTNIKYTDFISNSTFIDSYLEDCLDGIDNSTFVDSVIIKKITFLNNCKVYNKKFDKEDFSMIFLVDNIENCSLKSTNIKNCNIINKSILDYCYILNNTNIIKNCIIKNCYITQEKSIAEFNNCKFYFDELDHTILYEYKFDNCLFYLKEKDMNEVNKIKSKIENNKDKQSDQNINNNIKNNIFKVFK